MAASQEQGARPSTGRNGRSTTPACPSFHILPYRKGCLMLRQMSTQQAIGLPSVAGATLDATPDVEGVAEVTRRDELRFVWAFWAFIAVLTFANTMLNDAMT